MRRILFIGPDEKHFSPMSKRSLEKAIYAYIDFEVKNSPIIDLPHFFIRPDTGFTYLVAQVLKGYMSKHPDVKVFVKLVSEFITDFKQLPLELQQFFYDMVRREADPENVMDYGYNVTASMYTTTQSRTAYSEFFKGHEDIVYYCDNAGKINKRLQSELNAISSIGNKTNLFRTVSPEYFNLENIRKRVNGISYYYRINLKLPDGTPVTEENGGYACIKHAQYAREKRLREVLQQDVRVPEKTLDDVFSEYLETLGNKEALKKKYTSYMNALYNGPKDGKMETFCKIEDLDKFLGFGTRVRHYDKRFLPLNPNRHNHVISKAYLKGYFAFLMNLFDYAYVEGYISTQPLYFYR